MSLDLLGAEIGFDYGVLLQTAGGLLQGVASMQEEAAATDAAKGEASKKLAAAIAADNEAANAAAKAVVSAMLKSKSAKADAAAAEKAGQVQASAGEGLSPEDAQARTASAEKMLANAQARAKAKPKDGYLPVLVKAWTAVVSRLHNPAPTGGEGKHEKKESWWLRPVVGPLPGAAVVVGGVGLVAGLGFAIKKIFFKGAV